MCSVRNALSAVLCAAMLWVAEFRAIRFIQCILNFAICGVFCYLCDLCCALCAVRCAQICTLQFVLMYFLILIFTIFKRQALMKKANLSRPRRYRRQNISQKKSAVMPVWALFGCWSRTTAWWRKDTWILLFFMAVAKKKTRQDVASKNFVSKVQSHDQIDMCESHCQCDSTPLKTYRNQTHFFEPRFVVLRRKAQIVEAIPDCQPFFSLSKIHRIMTKWGSWP